MGLSPFTYCILSILSPLESFQYVTITPTSTPTNRSTITPTIVPTMHNSYHHVYYHAYHHDYHHALVVTQAAILPGVHMWSVPRDVAQQVLRYVVPQVSCTLVANNLRTQSVPCQHVDFQWKYI